MEAVPTFGESFIFMLLHSDEQLYLPSKPMHAWIETD